MTYRTQMMIVSDILKAVKDEDQNGGARVTSLLRKANVPYTRLSEMTGNLVKNGLLEEIPQERGAVFKLTTKGQEFLDTLERFEDFAKAFGLRL